MNRTALLAVPLTLLVPAVAVASDNKQVEISATPQPVEVVPLPCFPSGKLTLGMTNTGREATVADMRISGPPELTLSRHQFSSYLPVDQLVKAPLEVTVPRGTAPATYSVELKVGRSELEAPVTILPKPPKGPGDNLLLGEQAVASSTHGNVRLCGGVDGNADSEQWGASGWHDATKGVFPDNYGVDFIAPTMVGRIVVQTLDSARYPAAVMGIRDFDVQVRHDTGTGTETETGGSGTETEAGTETGGSGSGSETGAEWTTVSQVRGNTQGHVSVSFTPVTSHAVRLVIQDSNDHGYSRIVELQAYSN